MNIILDKTGSVPYFTNMKSVLEALRLTAGSFDWYLSDIDCNYIGPDFSSEDQWIDGVDLQNFLDKHEVQFIWGVFSAVPKGFRTVVENSPYVDGNTAYWINSDIRPQLAGALFEIACWDSSATILVGVPGDAIDLFCRIYPEARVIGG